jgi:hypothetical protein
MHSRKRFSVSGFAAFGGAVNAASTGMVFEICWPSFLYLRLGSRAAARRELVFGFTFGKSRMRESRMSGSGAAKLAAALVGESPTGRNCPVAVVVISSDEEGDQFIGSLEVKVSVGWGNSVRSAKGGEQASRS